MIPDDAFDRVVKEDDEVLTGQPEARTAAFWLRAYDDFGIEVTPTEEREDYIFIPWGAVLRIYGQDRPKLEQAEREAVQQDRPEDSEEAALSPDRQVLMDLLARAETPSEAADAKAAADGWSVANPSDGDVRMAREQLENRFPDDAEEANPT
jgi:hypothetical protein